MTAPILSRTRERRSPMKSILVLVVLAAAVVAQPPQNQPPRLTGVTVQPDPTTPNQWVISGVVVDEAPGHCVVYTTVDPATGQGVGASGLRAGPWPTGAFTMTLRSGAPRPITVVLEVVDHAGLITRQVLSAN